MKTVTISRQFQHKTKLLTSTQTLLKTEMLYNVNRPGMAYHAATEWLLTANSHQDVDGAIESDPDI